MGGIKFFKYYPSDSASSFLFYIGADKDRLRKIISRKIRNYKKFVFIIDKNIPDKFLRRVEEIIGGTGKIAKIDCSSKDITRLEQIWRELVLYVPECVVVVGGGTIGDISGFAAGTYQRGVPRIYFPTTVLSMVDASIGGKTGIDLANVKNSVGIINYPEIVVSYTPFLEVLPKTDYDSGFSEIVKAAVLYDERFFNKLFDYSKRVNNYSYQDKETIEVFYRSAVLKAKICEAKDNKKISLLYGHAVGNALEKISLKYVRHGEAVSIGMQIEGAIACILGIWDGKEWLKQREVLANFNLPIKFPKEVALDDLIDKMLLYKKLVDRKNFLFSLPKKIGVINNFNNSCLTKISKGEIKEVLRTSLNFIEQSSHV